ncbi:MAG: glutathione synthase [Rhodocyclaceae bacterium]|nr:glutathione synthase [Rhodocyclaceae bacterium]
MKLAFILDPLPSLKAYKDSSIAMMRAAARRGHEVHAVMRETLSWRDGTVRAGATRLEIREGDDWYSESESGVAALKNFDAVLMRQDPPFDLEYVAATWLLARAEAGGARILNRPGAIRDHNEKLAICEFPRFAPPTLVARDPADIQAFIAELGDVVLKPLDGMGGSRIFRVRRDDPNRNVIIETLTQDGTQTIMAQAWLPGVSDGDKRVLLIGGKVVPYCLARYPKAGEFRGNLAAGGTGIARPLSERDREIAETLAPALSARGLFLVGLDIIGEHLTEINVTSPTCFVEITQQTGFDVAGMFMDMLEQECL